MAEAVGGRSGFATGKEWPAVRCPLSVVSGPSEATQFEGEDEDDIGGDAVCGSARTPRPTSSALLSEGRRMGGPGV